MARGARYASRWPADGGVSVSPLHRWLAWLQVRKWAILDEELGVEIVPIRIVGLDEVDLPFALVLLQSFFAMDGRLDAVMRLEPDKPLHAVRSISASPATSTCASLNTVRASTTASPSGTVNGKTGRDFIGNKNN